MPAVDTAGLGTTMGTAASNEVSGGFAHGYIIRREDSKGNVSYQANVRKVGFPIISKTFPSKDETAAWAAETESSLGNGVTKRILLSSKTSMADLIDRYLTNSLPVRKAPQPRGTTSGPYSGVKYRGTPWVHSRAAPCQGSATTGGLVRGYTARGSLTRQAG